MDKFIRYDVAVQKYIKMLIAAKNDEVDVMDLIPASAHVQDERDEMSHLNPLEAEYEVAANALITALVDWVKGNDQADLADLEAAYSRVRRRLIVDTPVTPETEIMAA